MSFASTLTERSSQAVPRRQRSSDLDAEGASVARIAGCKPRGGSDCLDPTVVPA